MIHSVVIFRTELFFWTTPLICGKIKLTYFTEVFIMLQAGIKGECTTIVSQSNTARTMDSGTLDVFATPAMIALIEQAAYTSVADELEPGWGSVGTDLKIQHVASTPIGMTVTAKTELVEVDRRRLVFTAEVFDEAGLIGKGTHERFLVENEKFQAKANSKITK